MKKPSLRRKLFLARKAAEAVEKKGENDDYTYARFEDVLAEASKQLEKRGILVIPSMVEETLTTGKLDGSSGGVLAKAVIEYEVVDTEGDEFLKLRWAGTGIDTPGDKALFKATTGTAKYFLAHLLGIPFGSDPEASASARGAAVPPSLLADPEPAAAGHRLVVRDLMRDLEAAGAEADRVSVIQLLLDCGISADFTEETDLIPVTRDEADSVAAEIRRIKQDVAAERPDAPAPLPESELPEPDWAGLGKETVNG